MIGSFDWSSDLKIDNCQKAFTSINNKINDFYREAFPYKTFNKNKASNPLNPWMSTGLLKSRKTKEKLFLTKCKNPTYTNTENFQLFNNIYKNLCRKAKIKHWFDKFQTAGNNMKARWESIREAIGTPKKCSTLPGYFSHNGSKLRGDENIAEGFNNFFSTIGSKLDSELSESKIGYQGYLKGNIKSRFKFRKVNFEDIDKIISKLKPKNNPGSQLLSTKLLKLCRFEFNPLLAHVINLSFTKGIFPSELKIAKVIPIFKCEDSHIFGNYRPISLLPCLSKVFEKCMAHQLMEYFNVNNLFYELQFGFRPAHSTIHPLVQFLNYINKAHSLHEHALAIFIDLKKAFDTVNHEILLHKMKYYGITGISNT